MDSVVYRNVTDFRLDHIFDCGQAFRWERKEDGSYTGIAGTHIANMRFISEASGADAGKLVISNTTEEEFETFWRFYLDLDRDYGSIKKILSEQDSVMEQAVSRGAGIRILRQDIWETLLSFIISQNNHIPRIKKCIESLCLHFGEKAGEYQGRSWYAFPEPGVLASLEPSDLEVCKLGYRAKYLINTARQVKKEGIAQLEAMADPSVTPQEAFDYVTHFSGVGPKVANCILLFSMGKYGSFPVDVWIRRVMKDLYGLETPAEIKKFVQKNFKGYGGFAQQYLFYYIRETY